jgi:hypothetical protein
MESVREYRLLPSGLSDVQRRTIKRLLVPQMAVLAAMVIVSGFLGMRRSGFTQIVAFAVFVGLYITYMSFVSPRRVRRTLTKVWGTYVLTIGPDYLLRRQADVPDVRLAFEDVKKIERLPGRYLRIIGNARYQAIGIPESIENFPEILTTVSQIVPPAEQRRDRSLKSISIMTAGCAAYLVMLFSHSPVIVLPIAALLTGLLIWLFVFMQRSPNVLRRAKRSSWIYLFVTLLCVLKVLQVLGKL